MRQLYNYSDSTIKIQRTKYSCVARNGSSVNTECKSCFILFFYRIFTFNRTFLAI